MSIYKLYYNIYETSVVLYVLYINMTQKYTIFIRMKSTFYMKGIKLYISIKRIILLLKISLIEQKLYTGTNYLQQVKLYSGTKVIQQEKDVQWEKRCTAGQKIESEKSCKAGQKLYSGIILFILFRMVIQISVNL